MKLVKFSQSTGTNHLNLYKNQYNKLQLYSRDPIPSLSIFLILSCRLAAWLAKRDPTGTTIDHQIDKQLGPLNPYIVIDLLSRVSRYTFTDTIVYFSLKDIYILT